MFIFERERERERERASAHTQRRGREREGDRIWSRLQALSCQHRDRRGAQTHKLWDHDLSWSQTLNRLSHPGAPPLVFSIGRINSNLWNLCSKCTQNPTTFFVLCLFLRERERERESRGGAEREGDTESKAGSGLWVVSTEPDVGLKPTNREIMTWAQFGHLTYWTTQAPHK